MSRPFLIFLTLGLAGLGCTLLYSVIGSSVDAQGVLREPFFLIPIGFAMVFLGVIGTLGTTIVRLFRRTA
ncbi:DUF3955 domain-containing protein [Sedimentitalea nanhaiensis]|uniref:DUF3955 domain-containing protein n=1 Tax=Sedimentitalea nanhaiensis TaxID=999627 RepID=A0A1I7CQ68_9RHOB|nr:DUF3955 domain-containing protein [Sedimentitalea nanhaiensis]SFU01504.1 Protein of unknown function [Sedimentitalea nanhaiensis]